MNQIRDSLPKEQFSIWWVDLGIDNIKGHEQKKSRPFFLISKTNDNKYSKTPMGFLCSTKKERYGSRFSLKIEDENCDGYIKISQFKTLSDERFVCLICRPSPYLIGLGNKAMKKLCEHNDLNLTTMG